MFTIVYYDNITTGDPEIMYSFVRNLLKWVDENDAFLLIKSKIRRYKWGWIKIVANILQYLGLVHAELPIAKRVYTNYPDDIKKLMAKLVKDKKLVFRFKPGDVSHAYLADVIIVVPSGEIIFGLVGFGKTIIFFDPYNKCNITYFSKPEDIKTLLTKGKGEINGTLNPRKS